MTDESKSASAPRRPRGRLRRLVLRVFLLTILLAGAGFIALLWFSQQPPEWYDPSAAHAPEMAQRADDVEFGMAEAFHRIRMNDEPWMLALDEGDANAWLAHRLPEWIEHGDLDWPKDLGTPQLHFAEDGMHVAIPAVIDGRQQLAIARLQPRIVNGELQLDPQSLGLGRVGVPVGSMEQLLDAAKSLGIGQAGQMSALLGREQELVARIIQELSGGGPGGNGASVELSDGRLIELLDLSFQNGRSVMTNRTLAPGR